MAGAVEGFMRGYEFVDENIRQKERDQMLEKEAIGRQEQRQFERSRATKADERADKQLTQQDKQLQLTEQHYKTQDKRADSAERRAQQSEWRAQQDQARKQRETRRKELAKKADYYWRALENDIAPFPAELHRELEQEGMGHFSPYTLLDPKQVSSYERAGAVLQKLGSGKVSAINDPDTLADINFIYADQINQGIGEFNSPMGGKVARKQIEKIHAAPNGTFVADVRVELDNGKTYTAPITLHRSSHPDDPVRLNAAATAMDDLAGRAMLGQMAKNPQLRAKIAKAREIAFGTGGQMEGAPANAKMIEYLMQRGGLPFEEAQQAVLNSKDNPDKFARDAAVRIYTAEAKDLTAKKRPLSEIYAEVQRDLGMAPQAAPAAAGGAPAQPGAAPAQQQRVMTMADVEATAKSSGRTPQEVIQAAKAKGFIVQE